MKLSDVPSGQRNISAASLPSQFYLCGWKQSELGTIELRPPHTLSLPLSLSFCHRLPTQTPSDGHDDEPLPGVRQIQIQSGPLSPRTFRSDLSSPRALVLIHSLCFLLARRKPGVTGSRPGSPSSVFGAGESRCRAAEEGEVRYFTET